MTDRVLRLPLDRESLMLIADPTSLHKRVMTLLPDLGGTSTAIRADTGTLFRVDLPTDPLGTPGRISLRVRSNALAAGIGEPVVEVPLADRSRVLLRVAAERRQTDDRGIRVRPVSDIEAGSWVRELLDRHGFDLAEVALSPTRRFGSRQGVRFSVRDVAATVTVTDAEKAATAYDRGVGRGRAYGLGMIIPIQTTK